MSLAQDRWVLAAIAVVESAWLFAVFGVIGIFAVGYGSPLSWFAVLAVLGSSLVISRMLQLIMMPARVGFGLHFGLGLLVIYLTLASQLPGIAKGVDLAWIVNLTSETQGRTPLADAVGIDAVVAILMASGLWWRGGRLASIEAPDEVLMLTFGIGIVALGFAVVADAMYSGDLNLYPILFIFVASALGGLALSRLSPASARAATQGTWPKVIGGVVSGVLVIGLVFGLAQKFVLPFVARVIQAVLFFVADKVLGPVIGVIALPIAWVFYFVLSFVVWLLSLLPSVEGQPEGLELIEAVEEIRDQALDTSDAAEFTGWVLAAILLIGALYLMMRAYKRRRARRVDTTTGWRDSVVSEADPALDIARLLFNLLPERLRRRRGIVPYKLPEDEAGVVQALQIYYRMLILGEERKVKRSPWETPDEFQRQLEGIFPAELVRTATAAFNRACYGYYPASQAHLAEMQASLDGLASARA